MNCVLLYVTFARDAKWLEYSLKSFQKYCLGFSGVTIVVPTHDLDIFLPFERQFSTPECPVLIRTFLEYPGKGFVHHLAMKCSADIFCPQATHILHMDPDCLFKKPTTPHTYLVNDKPVLLIEPYEAIQQHGHAGRYGWKAVTEMALKFPCKYETMCRHPAMHYKWLYKALREHMEYQHLCPFTDFVLKQQNTFPQGYGEFNSLGSYAVERHSDKYHLIDRGFDEERNDPISHVEQMWSYVGVDTPNNQEAIKRILS